MTSIWLWLSSKKLTCGSEWDVLQDSLLLFKVLLHWHVALVGSLLKFTWQLLGAGRKLLDIRKQAHILHGKGMECGFHIFHHLENQGSFWELGHLAKKDCHTILDCLLIQTFDAQTLPPMGNAIAFGDVACIHGLSGLPVILSQIVFQFGELLRLDCHRHGVAIVVGQSMVNAVPQNLLEGVLHSTCFQSLI